MKDYIINTLPEVAMIPVMAVSVVSDNIWNIFGCIGGYFTLVGLRRIRKSIRE